MGKKICIIILLVMLFLLQLNVSFAECGDGFCDEGEIQSCREDCQEEIRSTINNLKQASQVMLVIMIGMSSVAGGLLIVYFVNKKKGEKVIGKYTNDTSKVAEYAQGRYSSANATAQAQKYPYSWTCPKCGLPAMNTYACKNCGHNPRPVKQAPQQKQAPPKK